MYDDRALWLLLAVKVGQIKLAGQHKVELHRGCLVAPAQGVFNIKINLWRIKCSVYGKVE